MSTPNTSHAVIQTPCYPTLEDLHSAQAVACKSSNAGDRIFWTLDGPLTTAISIMKDSHSPDSLEPYFQPTPDGGGTWHPASKLPVSEPKVSSITVRVDELETWEWNWKDCHHDHSEVGYESRGVKYGVLEDYDPDEDSEREEHLLMCCGEARPRKKAGIVVTAAASGKGFVTVHDYLSTIHPWLMTLREDIVKAGNVWDDGFGTEFLVNYNRLDCLMMDEKAAWIQQTSTVVDLDLMSARANREWPEFGPAKRLS